MVRGATSPVSLISGRALRVAAGILFTVALWAGLLAASAGCTGVLPGVGRVDQREQPYTPTGVAVRPGGDVLAVVSSNYDSTYETGSLLFADLNAVDAALAEVDDPYGPGGWIPGADVYFTGVYIPTFGVRPVFDASGDHVVVPVRGENLLVEVTLTPAAVDGGAALPVPGCGPSDPTLPAGQLPYCGAGAQALNLSQNDPYDVVLYDDDGPDIEGVVTFLQASELTFFRLRTTDSTATRFRLRGAIELGEGVLAVKGATLLFEGGDRPLLVIAVERDAPLSEFPLVELAWLEPGRRADAQVRSFDLGEATGARSARDMASTASNDALLVLLREPDALARVEVRQTGNSVELRLAGVAPTCDDPTGIELAEVPLPGGGTAERAYLVCLADHTVAAYDPLTLTQTDVVRDFGRAPYDIAVDVSSARPRAYVTFFGDDSVGVFDLLGDDGQAHLVPRGRIGQPSDREARQ